MFVFERNVNHVYNNRERGKEIMCRSALKDIKSSCIHKRPEGRRKRNRKKGRHACGKQESKEGMKDKCKCDL
jgi:hypothetical protein